MKRGGKRLFQKIRGLQKPCPKRIPSPKRGDAFSDEKRGEASISRRGGKRGGGASENQRGKERGFPFIGNKRKEISQNTFRWTEKKKKDICNNKKLMIIKERKRGGGSLAIKEKGGGGLRIAREGKKG